MTNRLGRVDPRTGQVKDGNIFYTGNHQALIVTPDGNPVIATSTVNGVGVVEVQ